MPTRNKNYRSEAMFPNYCFTRSGKEPGYDVVKRCYVPKDSHHQLHRRASRHLVRSETFAGCQQQRIGKRQADSIDQKGKRVKRLRKSNKKPNNVSRIDHESSSYRTPPPSRSVEFRLPPVVCEMPDKESNRQGGDAKPDANRENGGFESGDRGGREKATKAPNHDPNRDLQESCADFFSIIHDNVLELVQGTIQGMINKCFEKTIAQIAHLSTELTQQKTLLNKLYKEVTSKLTEQNETNLNQFKFLTQMLIDNQTIHYRSQQNKQRYKEEREWQREKARKMEKKRRHPSTSSSIDSQCRATGGDETKYKNYPQHKLCQQQQPNIYHTQICRNCFDQDANGKSRLRNQCSKIAPIKRLPKGFSTVSMPDLPRTETVCPKNRIKRIQTPNDTGGGQLRQSSRHRFFTSSRSPSVCRQSKETADPYYRPRSVSKAKRKLPKQSHPGEPNQDDMRSKR